MQELEQIRVKVISSSDLSFIQGKVLQEFRVSITGAELTKASYLKSVEKLLKWTEANNIQSISIKELELFRAELIDRYSVSTVNTIITGIKAFYNFLESHYQVTNIARSLKGQKKSIQPKRDALSINESQELLIQTTQDNSVAGLRDRAIITLMMYTGLRTCEVQRADIGDIRNKNGKKVLYIQGKGHTEKDDFVELTSDVQQAIRLYLSERTDTDSDSPLFTSESNRSKGQRISGRAIRHLIKEHYSAIGINSKTVTAHSLRHTAITLSLLGGASIQKAQAMARHSNISTTQIYAHNIERLSNDNAENAIQHLIHQKEVYAC